MQRYFVIQSFLLLLITAVTPKTKAQSPAHQSDSAAVFQLINSASLFFNAAQLDTASSLAIAAEKLARQKQYPFGQAWALIKWNDILIEADKLEEANLQALKLFKLGAQLRDSLVMAIALLHQAQVQLYSGRTTEAIPLFEKALAWNLAKAENSYTAVAYNDLGYSWGQKEELSRQADYSIRSLRIYEQLHDDMGCAMALGNLSTVFYSMGQRQKAIDYGKRSLQYREKVGDIGKLSLSCCNLSQMYQGVDAAEAARYQELCVTYAIQSGDEERMIHSYITSSLVANSRKDNAAALGFEMKAIALLEKSGSNPNMLARRYIAAAFLSETQGKDSAVALEYYHKAIRLSQAINSRSNLQDVYGYLSDYYVRKENYQDAYTNYKKHILYRDSLFTSEREANIAELEQKYQTARKDIEISRLNNEQRIKALEIEKQKAIILGNLLEARQKESEINLLQQQHQLQELHIKQQQEQLETQQLLARNRDQELQLVQKEKLLNEKQLQYQKQWRNAAIAGAVLLIVIAGFAFNRYQLKKKLEQQNMVQEMRNHIASDLHDDIGASLSNIQILNELTRRNAGSPLKVHEYLDKAAEDIRQVSEGISDIVWNINPRYDDLDNLFVRMKRYAADVLDGKNIHYQIDFPGSPGNWKLEMDKRRDLYLLFKEAINNLAKYSNASEARIKMQLQDAEIRLLVSDNGVGFLPAEVKSGNGLSNMRQRAAALQGTLQISSSPGKGTQIELILPV